MKKIIIFIAIIAIFAYSFSFENHNTVHGVPVMECVENIGEVMPVIKTGHDAISFEFDNFESIKLETSTNDSIVEMTDFGRHRQNLFLYSLIMNNSTTKIQLEKSNIFYRPCVSHDKGNFTHILC